MKTIIFSGFLGAGKTTLIKKLIKEAFKGEKLVLIENEFGEIGVDSGFLKECGIKINEINSGCICCSLVGDFTKALNQVVQEYQPETLFIEPSGVGKLSDVIKAVTEALGQVEISSVTVVDACKCKMYNKNFGEFFKNQIQYADTIILSHTSKANQTQISTSEQIVRELNGSATLITTDWDKLSAEQILQTISGKNTVEELIDGLVKAHHEHNHEHEHHHEHGEDCTCGCQDHDHNHEECGCEHEHHHEHHHEHGEDCTCGCHDHEHHHEHEECGCGHEHHHEHHHEHGENCTCGCHDHGHHADEVFTSFGRETTNKYTSEQIEQILKSFDEMSVGTVLRSKGIVEGVNGEWIHFDYIPGESDIRISTAEVIGKICVIGSDLDTQEIEKLFNL